MAKKTNEETGKNTQTEVEYVASKLQTAARNLDLAINKVMKGDEARKKFNLREIQELNRMSAELSTWGLALTWGDEVEPNFDHDDE